jgi:hypothetical protein
MGITPLHARLIVLEHKRRPLPPTVHLLGRQTVYLTVEGAGRLIRACGVEPQSTLIELDVQTRGAAALQSEYISDRMFFSMLGVEKIVAIDYTDYEGAEVIIDLNVPLPDPHVESIDFLFGGSVLDNIFDPATYLINVSKLLRPGGRVFDQNVISQIHHAYLLVTPAWLLDYYVINRFENLQVYIAEHSAGGFIHMYGVLTSADEMVSDFGPPRGSLALGVIVIAEKGMQSTADVLPIQDQYRSETDWGRYRASVEAMSGNEPLPMFEAPTALEMVRLDVRRSKSFRYLGVLRPNETHSSDVKSFEGDLPHQIGVGGLRIIAATYGGCGLGAVPTVAGVCAAYRGNVTDILASLANGHDEWHWTVDVQILGDPLPTVGKDLEVLYYFADEIGPKVRRAYIQPEAAGKALVLSRAMQFSG